jgi:hypothetical protein
MRKKRPGSGDCQSAQAPSDLLRPTEGTSSTSVLSSSALKRVVCKKAQTLLRRIRWRRTERTAKDCETLKHLGGGVAARSTSAVIWGFLLTTVGLVFVAKGSFDAFRPDAAGKMYTRVGKKAPWLVPFWAQPDAPWAQPDANRIRGGGGLELVLGLLLLAGGIAYLVR